MPVKIENSCADSFDMSLAVDEARQRIIESVTPIFGTTSLPLRDSLGRILAEDIHSPLNIPGHTNSAMDGYALGGDNLPSEHPLDYKVIGTAYAGKPYSGSCNQGEAVRIMTGAPLPVGTDTVVMQEHVQRLSNEIIRIDCGHRTGQNVRQAGEDISTGSLVLTEGRKLTPADLGVIASLGFAELKVRRRPRVAFFSTGDELCSIGQPLEEGQVYDSNRYTLFGMLKSLGVEILDLGVVKDNPEALRKAFQSAIEMADVIITSGGVSVGDADYVKEIMEELGSIGFWKIAMKPGRPLAYGHFDDTLFFGLPGNPVAVMVTFLQFVMPALRYMESGHPYTPLTIQAIATCNLRKRPGRFEFQRGILSHNENGGLSVTTTGSQGSGILTSMSRADCFILLNEESTGIRDGDLVDVQPFCSYV